MQESFDGLESPKAPSKSVGPWEVLVEDSLEPQRASQFKQKLRRNYYCLSVNGPTASLNAGSSVDALSGFGVRSPRHHQASVDADSPHQRFFKYDNSRPLVHYI